MLRTSLGSAVSSSQINDLAFYISFSYFSGEQFTKKTSASLSSHNRNAVEQRRD